MTMGPVADFGASSGQDWFISHSRSNLPPSLLLLV